MAGKEDREHLAFALAERRVLFTQDEDFLRLHDEGVAHAGIVYCHQQKHLIGKIIEGLVLLWEVYEPEEMKNQREYL